MFVTAPTVFSFAGIVLTKHWETVFLAKEITAPFNNFKNMTANAANTQRGFIDDD